MEGAENMRSRQHHRGPDDRGAYTAGPAALGHTRLCVLDSSSAGHQPMATRDGHHVIVYNGEAYNYRPLRDRLRSAGHEFRSDTDTEVVLHAWAEWGPDALDRLEGMFAFGVWDRKEHRLWLARDRLGVKPLYWHHDGEGTLLFASEVRALLASGRIDRRLDRSVLPFYLSQQTAPTPRTLVEGVRMLPPGCFAEVRLEDGEADRPQIRRYWDPLSASEKQRNDVAGRSRAELVSGLRERLNSAVERRLVADVPLGAFLSGGVDSTAVVGLMTQASDVPVRTFTVSFKEAGYDDGPYARLAADHFGTDHTEIQLSDEDVVASVPNAVAAQDHPSGDGINMWIVSRGAKEAGLTVALSGLGGDELFGGYRSFWHLAMLNRTRPILRTLPRLLRKVSGDLLCSLHPGAAAEKIASLLRTDGSVPEAYPVLRQVFAPDQVRSLLAEEVPEVADVLAPRGSAGLPYAGRLRRAFEEDPSLSLLQRASLAELRCYMRDVLLRDTDQMSMAHSLEVRVPFLDRDLVEYTLALPDEAREPCTPPKRYLVETLGELLPDPVAGRSKSGFTMPFDRWMRGPLCKYCEEGISRAAAHPAFRREGVSQMWESFLEGNRRLPWSRPWLLVALGHWLEREGIDKVV